jgi:hypothetical protein
VALAPCFSALALIVTVSVETGQRNVITKWP